MKKQVAIFLFFILALLSCKKEININIQLPEQRPIIVKTINYIDTILIANQQKMVEFRADVELNANTGEVKAKLLSPMPLYGWNLNYKLSKESKDEDVPVSEHTYKRIAVDSVRFKILGFPDKKDGKEYKVEITAYPYGSTAIKPRNKFEFEFKN